VMGATEESMKKIGTLAAVLLVGTVVAAYAQNRQERLSIHRVIMSKSRRAARLKCRRVIE
jgi:hypothetical protein